MTKCRSREGCSACRRRHVKCDERRPVCTRCYCKNETCDYGVQLIWPDESLAKGVSHGRGAGQYSHNRTGPQYRAGQSLQPFEGYHVRFLNTTAADIEQCVGINLPEDALVAVARTRSYSPLRHLQPIARPQYDGTLMDFYDVMICSTATIEDSLANNPFRGVLMPLALNSPAVSHALQAVAGKVISLREPSYRETTLSHHSNALRGLIATIDDLSQSRASLLEACAVSVLLCWFEISCNNHRKWTNHLSGLMHLLAYKEGSVELPPFIADYFLFHFIINRTILPLEEVEKPLKRYVERKTNNSISTRTCDFSVKDSCDDLASGPGIDTSTLVENTFDMTATFCRWLEAVSMQDINPYTGLSNGLLLIMNQITDLECPETAEKVADHSRNVAGIKTTLERLRQDAVGDVLPASKLQLSASAETYRLACLLYLHHRVTSIRTHIAVRTTSPDPLFTEPQVLTVAREILGHLEDNPVLMKTVANRLWPLFMAGCSANDDSLRLRVLGLFDKVEKDRRFWNVAPLRMAIEQIWRQRDLRIDEPIVPTRRYRKSQKRGNGSGNRGPSGSDWDNIVQLMANFTWSLT